MIATTAVAPHRSYLLRVTAGRGTRRFLIQDLRTGQRCEFVSVRDLHGFLAEHRPARLR